MGLTVQQYYQYNPTSNSIISTIRKIVRTLKSSGKYPTGASMEVDPFPSACGSLANINSITNAIWCRSYLKTLIHTSFLTNNNNHIHARRFESCSSFKTQWHQSHTRRKALLTRHSLYTIYFHTQKFQWNTHQNTSSLQLDKIHTQIATCCTLEAWDYRRERLPEDKSTRENREFMVQKMKTWSRGKKRTMFTTNGGTVSINADHTLV